MLKIKYFTSLVSIILSLPVYAEYQVEIISKQDPVKELAGSLQDPKFTDGEIPLLVYHAPDFKQTYAVTVKEWENLKRKDASRSHLFLQMYYANTRAKSNTGKRHIACFTGNASEVVNQFFKKENTIKNVKKLVLSTNSDQSLIGAEFTYTPTDGKKASHFHFRIPHCYQGGKAPLLTEDMIKTASSSYPEDARSVAQSEPVKNIEQTGDENCFESYDKLDPADRLSYKKRQLPYFKLRADYDKIKSNENSRPWKGLSLADEASAKKLSDVVLDYFYDSMIQNLRKPDHNFIAQNIRAGKNQWCHMPWLNVGEAGREAIHGLTKERELEPSSMYPTAGATPETLGAGWGIGFYNDISCGAIGAIFGTPDKPVAEPQFVNIQFPEGTASIKVLFTNAELPELKKSFTMTANVSLNGETHRRLRPVKLIQIDVAIKDSTVIGTKPEADHWFMISYYFDANYKYTSKHKYKSKYESLLKMRPIGVQVGFTPEDSIIFKDSKTNSVGNAIYTEANKLLNGPADNSKASCLSCHGAAGTMLRMVPGVKDFTQYTRIKKSTLDFSQQLALAKKNYETRSGQLKAVSFK